MGTLKPAYLIDGIRTPVASFQGALSTVRTDDMAVLVLKELLVRNKNIEPEAIGDVILGCANQSGEDNRNVARMALLMAGLPVSVPGETVNRLCASGLSASIAAARSIMLGEEDLMISGGVENMTRGPWVMSKTSTAFGRDAQLFDSSFGWRFVNEKMKAMYGTDAMGETAENLAERDKISREDQDKFAYHSQLKAAAAQKKGRLAQEIVAVSIPQRKGEPVKFEADEFIKPSTTLPLLAGLKTSFRKDGTVTAGNSSGLNDGAAALLLASEEAIKKYGLQPRARIVSSAVTGVEPRIMGIGPVSASNKALQRAGLSMKDMDIIELNEAFAAQSLACLRAWGLADDDPRVNPNGGAIAIGHPLGMSGARILNSAALELHQPSAGGGASGSGSIAGRRYALVTMCIGLGQGYAVIIEKV